MANVCHVDEVLIGRKHFHGAAIPKSTLCLDLLQFFPRRAVRKAGSRCHLGADDRQTGCAVLRWIFLHDEATRTPHAHGLHRNVEACRWPVGSLDFDKIQWPLQVLFAQPSSLCCQFFIHVRTQLPHFFGAINLLTSCGTACVVGVAEVVTLWILSSKYPSAELACDRVSPEPSSSSTVWFTSVCRESQIADSKSFCNSSAAGCNRI